MRGGEKNKAMNMAAMLDSVIYCSEGWMEGEKLQPAKENHRPGVVEDAQDPLPESLENVLAEVNMDGFLKVMGDLESKRDKRSQALIAKSSGEEILSQESGSAGTELVTPISSPAPSSCFNGYSGGEDVVEVSCRRAKSSTAMQLGSHDSSSKPREAPEERDAFRNFSGAYEENSGARSPILGGGGDLLLEEEEEEGKNPIGKVTAFAENITSLHALSMNDFLSAMREVELECDDGEDITGGGVAVSGHLGENESDFLNLSRDSSEACEGENGNHVTKVKKYAYFDDILDVDDDDVEDDAKEEERGGEVTYGRKNGRLTTQNIVTASPVEEEFGDDFFDL